MSSSRSSRPRRHPRARRPRRGRRRPSPRSPRASSASTTCEPMKPAPPVTIARSAIARGIYTDAVEAGAASRSSTAGPTRRSARARACPGARRGRLPPTAGPPSTIGMLGVAGSAGRGARSRPSPRSRGPWRPRPPGRGDWLSTISSRSLGRRGRCRRSCWKPAAASWSWTICSPSVCSSPFDARDQHPLARGLGARRSCSGRAWRARA